MKCGFLTGSIGTHFTFQAGGFAVLWIVAIFQFCCLEFRSSVRVFHFYSAMLHEILKHGEMKLPCMLQRRFRVISVLCVISILS